MAAEPDDARVVVAVLTYRRAELLAPLLTELVGQVAALGRPAEVLVVDNDPDAGAETTVRPWAGSGVRYVCEVRPGISAARNRALAEAGDAGALVFIDDDELPLPGWLDRMVGAWRGWACAAVAGPVSYVLPHPVDPWVLGTGVFARRRLPTGTSVGGAGAGNLLLDLRQVRALGLSFDERLGLTGGEDTLLTHQLVHRGGELRWCDEAEAVESVPAERTSRAWAARRCFRSAGSWSRAEVALAAGPAGRARVRATVLAKAAARTALAAGAWGLAAARRDVAGRGAAVGTLASHAGLVVGAFGFVPGEYARRTPAPGPVEELPRVPAV